MIGPDPFAGNDAHKPIVLTHHGKSVRGTFLFDTGAATSMISTKLAKELGIDIAKEQKFSLPIGGLGGAKNSSGLYVDRLEIPTRENRPIVYTKAPLLVCDISVSDADGKSFTLDGVLGMNYLVASAEVTGGLLPDIGKIVNGPFRWIVIDHANRELGLEPN
jgi:hypothetical protein